LEDEATEENYVRRDSAVSFDVNGDDIIVDSDAFGENAETTDSEGSRDEGEDQLSPLEVEVQEPWGLNQGVPCAAAETTEEGAPSKRRFSSCVDIETGKDGGARTHKVLVSV
jgi:hypothetical protein